MMEGEPEPEIMFMAVSSRVKPLAVGGGQVQHHINTYTHSEGTQAYGLG